MKRTLFMFCLISLLAVASGASAIAGHGQVTGIVSVTNGHVRLSYATSAGTTYQLQRNDDLRTRWWADEGAVVTALTSQATADCDAGVTNRFFRVLEFTNSVFWYDWNYRSQNPSLSTWGLGATETAYSHLDRSYDWYIDQANTGISSNANCGPSSVVMAMKWYNNSFSNTAEGARNWSSSWRGTGWWYTDDIDAYLRLYSVPHVTSAFTGTNQLRGLVEEGKLVILCMNTYYLTQNPAAEERTGRFYSYASGHFLVLKGVRSVSGSLFFEVYDPNNWDKAYGDGTPKGRNRHVKASELAASISNHWNYVIVVQPPASGGGGGGDSAQLMVSKWITLPDGPVEPGWGM